MLNQVMRHPAGALLEKQCAGFALDNRQDDQLMASCGLSSLQPGRRMQRMRQGCFCQSDTALTGPPSRSSNTASARSCHATASALLASASLDIVYALMPSKKCLRPRQLWSTGFSVKQCGLSLL